MRCRDHRRVLHPAERELHVLGRRLVVRCRGIFRPRFLSLSRAGRVVDHRAAPLRARRLLPSPAYGAALALAATATMAQPRNVQAAGERAAAAGVSRRRSGAQHTALHRQRGANLLRAHTDSAGGVESWDESGTTRPREPPVRSRSVWLAAGAVFIDAGRGRRWTSSRADRASSPAPARDSR